MHRDVEVGRHAREINRLERLITTQRTCTTPRLGVFVINQMAVMLARYLLHAHGWNQP